MVRKILDPVFEGRVDGLGSVYSLNSTYSKVIDSFSYHGLELLSARDYAYVVMNGELQSLFNAGAISLREGWVYADNESPLLVRKPLSTLPDFAWKMRNDEGTAFFDPTQEPHHLFSRSIYDEYREIAEHDKYRSPEDRRVFIFNDGKKLTVPDFPYHHLTRFLFQDLATEYSEFITDFRSRTPNPDNRSDMLYILPLESCWVDANHATILKQVVHNFGFYNGEILNPLLSFHLPSKSEVAYGVRRE